jgi:hypothetical protein
MASSPTRKLLFFLNRKFDSYSESQRFFITLAVIGTPILPLSYGFGPETGWLIWVIWTGLFFSLRIWYLAQ